jgi:hypothetical protein
VSSGFFLNSIKVLDLYGITDPGEQQRILGSASNSEEDEANEVEDVAENEIEEAE